MGLRLIRSDSEEYRKHQTALKQKELAKEGRRWLNLTTRSTKGEAESEYVQHVLDVIARRREQRPEAENTGLSGDQESQEAHEHAKKLSERITRERSQIARIQGELEFERLHELLADGD